MTADDLGIAVGETVRFAFVVTAEDQQAFARLSGDTNPMHLDADAARARGFDAPVVYGGLIVAKISRVVGMHWPGSRGIWADLEIRFRKPLLVGEEAALVATIDQVSPASNSVTIDLAITSAKGNIARAKVLAVLFPRS